MAGADYIHCNECGKRLIYDGNGELRCHLGFESLTCRKCVDKMKKKINKLKKHDRRRH